jgi:enamine deaminase RidA (YjgF/YER057c/UK114 family)
VPIASGALLVETISFCISNSQAQYFSVPYPARAALGIKELPRGAQVEMDGVLVKEADPE